MDRETFGFLITDIARMTRAQFERRVAAQDFGLTTAEARTLVHVAACDGARQTTLAGRMNIEPMTASKLIDRLEERGLVRREQDPADRRANIVTLTPEGERLITEIQKQTSAMREEAMEGLSEAEREVLMAALRKVRGNLQAVLCRAEKGVAA